MALIAAKSRSISPAMRAIMDAMEDAIFGIHWSTASFACAWIRPAAKERVFVEWVLETQ
jgi:hypothetical protein